MIWDRVLCHEIISCMHSSMTSGTYQMGTVFNGCVVKTGGHFIVVGIYFRKGSVKAGTFYGQTLDFKNGERLI